MRKTTINAKTYRMIPSHFPPIALFENLLDPQKLDAAYALESLTNDRIQQEVGNIHLVQKEDRMVGAGSSAIMAAFTHAGAASRFSNGSYGVYYAGLSLETAIRESMHSRARFLSATNESAQILTMRCYQAKVSARLVDVRHDEKTHDPIDLSYPQALGQTLKHQNELGILYASVRHNGGECIAALRPTAITPPAIQTGHYQYYWNGHTIESVSEVKQII